MGPYIQNSASRRAVRNSKRYYKYQLPDKAKTLTEQKIDETMILNLACGPSRIINDFLTENPTLRKYLAIPCIDVDENAITFSKDRNKEFLDINDYKTVDLFKYDPNEKFDIIRSSGFFDYVNENIFIKFLKRFYSKLNSDGEIIIGKFFTSNHCKALMELFDWHLNPRGPNQLIQLAALAIDKEDLFSINAEKEVLICSSTSKKTSPFI